MEYHEEHGCLSNRKDDLYFDNTSCIRRYYNDAFKEMYSNGIVPFNLKKSIQTALMVAVEREDIETLKVLFEVGIDPNDSSSSCNGSTALTLATQKDLTLSVKELVRMGAHFTCETGIEALELAVSKCFFQDLIAGENKLFSGDEPKEPFKTAIVVAFESGRQSLLTKLLSCGLSLERTLLLDSTSNQPDLVRLLLDNGVDVNAASPSLATALHKSAQNNNIESIKLLVGANSNINAVNKDGQTALHKAVCVVYSERSYEPELKMEKINLEIIQFLIENKANIDAEDQIGDTVLHKAVQYDKTETVKLLIEAKADANATNKSGETALHKAVDVGNTEIVKLLIGIGSNINATNVDGDTVLHKAVRRNNINIIELLVNANINIEAVNKNGETALHAASAERCCSAPFNRNCTDIINLELELGTKEVLRSTGYGRCAIVQYLIEAGGDVNLEDRYGNTPLSIAVNNDNLMLAHILIKAKADVNKMIKKNRSFPSTSAQQISQDHVMESYFPVYATDYSSVSPSTDQDLMPSHTPDQSLLWMTPSIKCPLTEMAKLLIHHGADVNIPNEDNTTFLMLAVDQLDVKWVETVIAAGADVNATDNYGNSVLICALRLAIQESKNHKHLTSLGNNYCTYYAHTNFAHAVERSHKILQLLLKAGCSVYSQNFPNPMVLAVNSCHKDYVKLLLEHGGNVNAQDDELNTLIMLALRNNSLDIVKILLASGADVINFTNKFGDMTLHFAAKCKNSQMMRIVLEKIVGTKSEKKMKVGSKRHKCNHSKVLNVDILNNRSETPLYKAAASGRWKNVKLLLQYGASADIQSKNGNTALIRALKHGFENVTEILLTAKADVNIRNKCGENALLNAAESGCSKMVKLLIDAGADPLSSTNMGNTGLSLAANKDIAELFLQAGADVNLRNIHGQTLMHCAVKRGKEDVLMLLLKHGANVNIKDFYGNTPLIVAHKVSQSGIILNLLGAKANVNLQNKKGKTALMYATNITDAFGYDKELPRTVKINVVDLLLKSGADVNLKDNLGRTALMYSYKEKCECDNIDKLIKHGADLEAEDYQGRTVLVQLLQAYGIKLKIIELLKLGKSPVLKAKYRNILTQPYVGLYIGKEKNELLRLLICNGIVNMVCFESYFPSIQTFCVVELCLWFGTYDLLRYILANCYISDKDLAYIRLRGNGSSIYTIPEIFTGNRTPELNDMDELIQKASSKPWPLINLAFIAVSTMMGESPEREVRIGNSQLPNLLKDMLMFQTEVARKTVAEWSTLPVCFEA